jgi:hypothetical protein
MPNAIVSSPFVPVILISPPGPAVPTTIKAELTAGKIGIVIICPLPPPPPPPISPPPPPPPPPYKVTKNPFAGPKNCGPVVVTMI